MKPQSLFEKAAQLLFPRIGSNMRPSISVEEDEQRVATLLESCPVGGLVLFNGTLENTPDVLSRLQRRSSFPLLIGMDMERGLGQQLSGATVFPHAFAFGSLGSGAIPAIERSTGIAAREALGCGIHVSFSPVADVHSNPDNPIISIRSFGTTVADVSDRVAAYIQVCKDKGLLCTAKHFPGHGETDTDSHDQIPVVGKSRQELEQVELKPFQAAIQSGVDLIMTAHVSYPGLDPEGTVATLSKPILTDVLRKEMGFQGVIITDSLLMEGANAADEFWEARMVAAGVDILLDVPNPEESSHNLVRAVDRGLITEERLDASVDRIWRLKKRLMDRYGDHFFVDPSAGGKRWLVGSDDHWALSQQIADKAVSVVSGSVDPPPFSVQDIDSDGLLILFVRPHTTYSDPTAESLESYATGLFKKLDFSEVTPETTEEEYTELMRRAVEAGGVIVSAVVKPAAWHRFGLLPRQSAFIQQMSERRAIILAAMGSDRVIDEFPDVSLGLCAHSDVGVSNQAMISFVSSLLES